MRMEVTTNPAMWTRQLKVGKPGACPGPPWSDVRLPGPSSPLHIQLLPPSLCPLWLFPYPLLS